MRKRHLGPAGSSPRRERGTSIRGSWRRAQRTAMVLVAIATAGCSTPDYSYARESRNDRPYRGGAASVPDEEPADPRASGASRFEGLAVFSILALMLTRPESYSPGPPRSQFGPPPPPPPPQSK